YLVHPVLAELVTEFSPEYARNIDPVNVVGDGRPWREHGETADGRERPLCVLKADIKEFSRFMESTDTGQAVGETLRKAAAQHAAHCIWYEVSEGDAVTLAHDDANAIVNVALRMSEDLFEAPGNPQLRIALDHGPVRLDDGPDGRPTVVGGEPLRRAARLRPPVTGGRGCGNGGSPPARATSPTGAP